jgi:hypothetical protein
LPFHLKPELDQNSQGLNRESLGAAVGRNQKPKRGRTTSFPLIRAISEIRGFPFVFALSRLVATRKGPSLMVQMAGILPIFRA